MMTIPRENAVYKTNFFGTEKLVTPEVKVKVLHEFCPECAEEAFIGVLHWHSLLHSLLCIRHLFT